MHTLWNNFNDQVSIQMNRYSIFVNTRNTLNILNLCAYNTHNVILIIQTGCLFFSFDRNRILSIWITALRILKFIQVIYLICTGIVIHLYCILTHLQVLDTIWKLLQTQNEGNRISQILETKNGWMA